MLQSKVCQQILVSEFFHCVKIVYSKFSVIIKAKFLLFNFNIKLPIYYYYY